MHPLAAAGSTTSLGFWAYLVVFAAAAMNRIGRGQRFGRR
jgi:hypothetical protein